MLGIIIVIGKQSRSQDLKMSGPWPHRVITEDNLLSKLCSNKLQEERQGN